MLIKWVKKKDRNKPLTQEDDIVATVFGALVYLTDIQRNRIFRKLLIDRFPNAALPDSSGCAMEFWPNIAQGGRIEPDLVLRFVHVDGSISHVLIEAKWNSQLSDQQLAHQWIGALAKANRHLPRHILLSRSLPDLDTLRNQGQIRDEQHRAQLAFLTWSRLAYLSTHLQDVDPGLKAWGEDVANFLGRHGETCFIGFGWIQQGKFAAIDSGAWRFSPKLQWPELFNPSARSIWQAKPWRYQQKLVVLDEATIGKMDWLSTCHRMMRNYIYQKS